MMDAPFHVDRQTHAIRMERRIRATPAWAFNAWTDPAQLRLWWDPTGRPLAVCEVDLRIGGALRLVGAGDHEHPFTGTYRLIDPPHRLEFDALGAHGTVTFRPAGDVTEMVLEIRCASAEHLAQFLQMGVAEGTAQTVANLVALAERVAA